MKKRPILTVVLPYGPGNLEIEGEVELDWEDIINVVDQLDEEDRLELAKYCVNFKPEEVKT